jgi:hypothetical protein
MASKISIAQSSFALPQKIQLKEKTMQSMKVVIEAAIWLEQADLDKDVEKRKILMFSSSNGYRAHLPLH